MPRDVISPTSSGLKAQTGKLTASLTNAITRKLTGAELEQLFLEKFKLTLSGTELIDNGDFTDLVINGDFATDSNWTKATGWSIGSGVASCDGTQTSGTSLESEANIAFVSGKKYTVTYTLTISAGSVDARLQGGTAVVGTARTSSGTYTEVLTAVSGNNKLRIRGNASFVGTVDNVAVVEGQWTGTGASISNGKLKINVTGGAYAFAYRPLSIYETGETYQVSFTVNGPSGKSMRCRDDSGNSGGLNLTNGIVDLDGTDQQIEVTFKATSGSDELIFERNQGSGDWSFTVDNISLKKATKQAPVAAFSLRKLGNVSPYACRIRRSYDNTEAQVFFDASDRVSESSVVRNTSQNLFSNSEDFVNAWGNAAVATSNTHPNPIEGAMTADTVGSNGGVKHRTISATLPQTGNYTYSIYLKRKTGTGAIRIGDFTDGTNEVAVTSEWQRFSRTAYLAAGTHTFTLRIDTTNDEVYAWGAMLQQTVYESTPSGSELVTNGTFDTDSGWVKGTGWTTTGGVATRTTQSGSTACDQSLSLIAGRQYRITYTLTRTAGTFRVRFAGTTNVDGADRTASGTYTDTLTAVTGNNQLRLVGADGAFAGTVDNVSVKELLPEVSEYISTPVVSNDGLTFTETTLDDFVGGENLRKYSNEFNNASWGITNFNAAENNNIANPVDGTVDAMRLRAYDTGGAARHEFYTRYSATSGVQYAHSIYLKPFGTVTHVIGSDSGSNSRAAAFDLVNGTVVSNGLSNQGATIEPVGSDGWMRVTFVFTATATISDRYIYWAVGDSASLVSGSPLFANYDADGTGQGVYAWGSQVNLGTTAKDPTKTEAIIREGNAGVVVLYNQTGGEDIIQDTQARQPLLYKQGLLVKSGSSPALAFDGTDDSLIFSDDDFSDTLNLNSLSSFVVFKSDDDNQSGWVLALGTNTGTKRWYAPNMQGGNFQFSYGSSSGTAQSTDDTNAHLASAVAGASNGYKAYLDGVEKGSTSVQNNSNDTDPAFIGAISQGSLHFEGKIYELIIFDTDQSTNRVSIEKDINDFHNLF